MASLFYKKMLFNFRDEKVKLCSYYMRSIRVKIMERVTILYWLLNFLNFLCVGHGNIMKLVFAEYPKQILFTFKSISKFEGDKIYLFACKIHCVK